MSDLSRFSVDARRGISAAELHGAACGIAVPDPERASALVLIELLGPDALTEQDAVERFMAQTVSELTSESMIFAPLLADAADLNDPEQVEPELHFLPQALSEWCAAFVAGLVAGLPAPTDDSATDQWAALQELGPDSQEIVSDLLAIAEIEHESDELEEDDMESALTELVEYVRVAVLLLLAPPDDAPPVE